MTYRTATNLALFPENSKEDVQTVASLLGFDLKAKIAFKPNPNLVSKRSTSAKHPFPTPCTVEEALARYVDLRSALRKKLLTDLAAYCSNEVEK